MVLGQASLLLHAPVRHSLYVQAQQKLPADCKMYAFCEDIPLACMVAIVWQALTSCSLSRCHCLCHWGPSDAAAGNIEPKLSVHASLLVCVRQG